MPSPAVTNVDLRDLLRVHCAWQEPTNNGRQAVPRPERVQRTRVIHAWAVRRPAGHRDRDAVLIRQARPGPPLRRRCGGHRGSAQRGAPQGDRTDRPGPGRAGPPGTREDAARTLAAAGTPGPPSPGERHSASERHSANQRQAANEAPGTGEGPVTHPAPGAYEAGENRAPENGAGKNSRGGAGAGNGPEWPSRPVSIKNSRGGAGAGNGPEWPSRPVSIKNSRGGAGAGNGPEWPSRPVSIKNSRGGAGAGNGPEWPSRPVSIKNSRGGAGAGNGPEWPSRPVSIKNSRGGAGAGNGPEWPSRPVSIWHWPSVLAVVVPALLLVAALLA